MEGDKRYKWSSHHAVMHEPCASALTVHHAGSIKQGVRSLHSHLANVQLRALLFLQADLCNEDMAGFILKSKSVRGLPFICLYKPNGGYALGEPLQTGNSLIVLPSAMGCGT